MRKPGQECIPGKSEKKKIKIKNGFYNTNLLYVFNIDIIYHH